MSQNLHAEALREFKTLIRESHVDALGHMNNATYLQLFEEARWDIITERGYGFKEVVSLQQGPIILDVSLRFMNEVHLREEIRITSEMIEQNRKVGKMKQVMYKENGAPAAEAIFTVAFFDMKTRKIIEPSDLWKKAIGVQI